MNKLVIIILTLFLFSSTLFSQDENEKKIKKEIECIIKNNAFDLISLSRSSGEGIILYKQKEKFNIIKYTLNSNNKLKKRKYRMNRKIKSFYLKTLNDNKFLIERKNNNCFKMAHSFYRYNVIIILKSGKSFTNNFFSHCGTELEKEKLLPLISELYK